MKSVFNLEVCDKDEELKTMCNFHVSMMFFERGQYSHPYEEGPQIYLEKTQRGILRYSIMHGEAYFEPPRNNFLQKAVRTEELAQ